MMAYVRGETLFVCLDPLPAGQYVASHSPTSRQAGFNRVMGGTSIALLRPEELELLVCGTPHLNFHELEEVARYEGCVHALAVMVTWRCCC